MSLSIPGQCHSLYTTTLFGVSGSTLYQHLGRCLQFSRGLLMANEKNPKTSLNDIRLMTCVIPYKIDFLVLIHFMIWIICVTACFHCL